MRRLFYSTLYQVISELDVHFSRQNTKLYATVSTLQPQNSNFLDVKMEQPLLDLVDCASVEAEFDVAKTYIAKFNDDETTSKPATANDEHDKSFCTKAITIIDNFKTALGYTDNR